MGFTVAQQAAIDQSGKTVLVSAAAGSGKTYTLTQRIIKKIIEDGADISRMLIVTFTRAAAGELKSRISSALSEEIAKHPENRHLQNQMLLIPSAKICTIDSFFTDPVKSNFDKLGLPAKVRLADSTELEDTRNEIFSSVIENMHARYGISANSKLSDISSRNEFTDLIYLLTSSRSTGKLISILYNLYNRLITSPLGVEILKNNAQRLLESADKDFFDTPEGEVIKQDILFSLGTSLNVFRAYIDRMEEDEFVKQNYIFNFTENCDMCISLMHKIQKTSFEKLSEAFEVYAPSKLTSIKKNDVTPFSEECKNARTGAHKKILDIKKKYLAYTNEDIKNEYIATSKINLLLYDILSMFDKKYRQAKKDAGLFEFSDMPRFLLELLGDGTTPVAKEMREMYDEVYIDEYQDVNEIQDTIFKIIGGTHRFMVGDIKQSIYGFRDAMPSLFAGYKNAFPLYTDSESVEATGGCTIFMSENFRCDKTVISFTNAVCSALFEASSEAINYTKNDDLVFQKMGLPENYEPADVQINIFDDGKYSDILTENEEDESEPDTPIITEDDVRDTDIPNEALYCAQEILRLIKSETKPNGAPISFGDIAILVRVKHHAPLVAAALKKYGIEYCLSASNQLFDSNDMKSLLDLLRAIDNPEDDMALCSFLTSTAYDGEPMFSLEEIVTIRKSSGVQKSLYRAMFEYSDTTDKLATLLTNRVSNALEILKSLRALSRRVAIDKLLRVIKTIPDFKLICDSEAYTYIYDCACNYVKRSWNGLYAFLKYYKKLAESGNVTLKEASNTNAVNIMTIHQSKGLEYHAVFLYGCSRAFSTKESKIPVNYDRSLCVATKSLVEEEDEDGIKYIASTTGNIIKNAVVKSVYNESLLEEMRILYVGLTRARERLYISATINEEYASFRARMKMLGREPYAIMKQKSFIEWIFASLGDKDEDSDIGYKISVHSAIKIIDEIPDEDQIQSSVISATKEEMAHVSSLLYANRATDSEKLIASIPSKVAASKAVPNMLDESLDITDSEHTADAIRARLSLMSSAKKDFDSLLSKASTPSASDIGTATHSFLQLCDFDRVVDTSIDSEIQLLIDKKYISIECANMINRRQINMFFESNLFKSLKEAVQIHKEFKFGIYKNASEFTNDPEISKLVSDKVIYIQGAIDLIIIFPDGSIHICDYKTDRILPEEKENIKLFQARMKERHKNQLCQYRSAIEQIFKKSPEKIYLYSLPLGETIEIEL